jgi:hypothetical protein
MMTNDLQALATQARAHAEHAQADIVNAGTRQEYIRLTGLAVEAKMVADNFDSMLALYAQER